MERFKQKLQAAAIPFRHSCLSCRKTSSSSAVQLRFVKSRLSAITCWATAATSCLRTKAFPAW